MGGIQFKKVNIETNASVLPLIYNALHNFIK